MTTNQQPAKEIERRPILLRGTWQQGSLGWDCPCCDNRYGPIDLLIKHLTERKFGGHDLTITSRSLRFELMVRG